MIRTCTGPVLALALTAAVTACSNAPTPTTTPSAVSTPSSMVPSSAEHDLVAAQDSVVRMWAVLDRLAGDPGSSIQDLDDVASGQVLTMLQENLMAYRGQRWAGSGRTIVEHPHTEPAGVTERGLSTWTVTACIDRSSTRLVDDQGESVQGPPFRISHRSTVVQRAGSFRVDEDQATGTC